MALLPESVALWEALALVAVSFLTSGLTAAVGIGGGVLMLVAMAQVVPIVALVPLHGAVQLASNLGRVAVLARAVSVALWLPFLIGSAAGALVGGISVSDVPESTLLIIMGAFVLVTTWTKVPPLGNGAGWVIGSGGFVTTVLTMFVGATGPLTMALYKPSGLAHRPLVATVAAAMTVQQLVKTVVFGLLGFAFAAWLPLLMALVVAGFLGTLAGTRFHTTVPETVLRRTLNIVLTIAALQLLARGVLLL